MKSDKEHVAKLVQEAVDKGASTAEEIHRSIADLPITVLENMGVAGETTQNVKKLQDTTIGAIYELVREINHQVTDLADELISSATKKETKPKPKSKAKKEPADA